MTKKRIVVGNWKTSVATPCEAKDFAIKLRRHTRSFSGVEAWLAPSFTLVAPLAAALARSTIKVGAQSVSGAGEGVHTGEVTPSMLKTAGASFVIVGHSERRALGESEETIRRALTDAAVSGLSVILCVGERERDEVGTYFETITSQLTSALTDFPRSRTDKLLVAYEPVWAIGKSAEHAMKPAEVQEMHIFIRKTLADILGRERALAVPVLYGGSVEPTNAKELITEGGVAGFLVGHASSEAGSFVEILKAVRQSSR